MGFRKLRIGWFSRCILILILTLSFLTSVTGQIIQRGIVVEYDLQQHKKSLGGVNFDVRGASSTVSAPDGKFSLNFRTQKAGDRVVVRRIEKSDYELFDPKSIEQWHISADGSQYTIMMCRSERIREVYNSYYSLSSANYAKQLKKEESRLLAQRKANKMSEEQYRKELADIRNEYEEKLEHLDTYINHFTRIDLTKLSAEESNIVTLAKQGKLEEAAKCYDNMQLEKRYEQEASLIAKIDASVDKLKKEKERGRQAQEECFASLMRERDVKFMAGGNELITSMQKKLIQVANDDPTYYPATLALADFLSEQHQMKEAIHWYEVSVKNSENDNQRIGAKLGRANAYNVAGQYQEAIKLYSEAIKDVEQTFKGDDVSTLIWYKELAYALASLESTRGNFEEAKGYLTMNMTLLEDLSKQYPELFMKDIANYQNLQAYCCFRLGEMKQARDLIKRALTTFSTLPEKDGGKDDKKMNIAMAKRMLADIEYQMRNLETAKQNALEALDIAQKLYSKNTRKYRSLLIDCEKMVGSALRSVGDNTSAINHLQHVLELCKEQTTDLPNQQAYHKIESNTLISLGWAYRGLNKQQEALAAFKKALGILGTLDIANTDAANRQAEVNANYGCGQVLLYSNHVNEAVPYYQKAVKLASAIYQIHPSLIANDLHISLYALSSCYYQTNRLDQALSYAKQDINLIKRHQGLIFDQPESAFIMAIYVYNYRKDYQSALASTDELLRILPESNKRTSYQFFRGRMILKLGKKKEAMKLFQELEPKIMAMSRMEPHNVDYLDTKGELLMYLGREAEARQVWNNLLKVEPQFIKKYGQYSDFCKMMMR